eukprot:6055269-Amphidinium_carterae.1
MKVYHFWRLVGPQLRDRPEELPAEPPAPPVVTPRVPDTDAPFQLGEHQRVVKHASFLQCLDCTWQAGRVKLRASTTLPICALRTADRSRPRSTRRDLQ